MVLLGANSAGKSTVVTVLRMLKTICQASGEPDLTKELPELASFDSVVRKQWSKKQARPQSFQIEAIWVLAKNSGEQFAETKIEVNSHSDAIFIRTIHTFRRHPIHGGTQLLSVHYSTNLTGMEELKAERMESPGAPEPRITALFSQDPSSIAGPSFNWLLTLPDGTTCGCNLDGISLDCGTRTFHPNMGGDPKFALLRTFIHLMRLVGFFESQNAHRVIAPERPKPRSYYVLDDPSFTESERTFIEELMVAWFAEKEDRRKSETDGAPAHRIVDSLKVLGLVKHFGVKRSKTAGPEIVSIEVSTSSGREKVALSDVGFGVSQILPLIVKESLSEGAELVVYQPEVHLHPTAQSKLADFFVGAWRRGNRSIIETHSTYLIMRLQVLVAMGIVPEGTIEVLCVERENTETKVKKMEFDDLGRPKGRWPKGFIDTSTVLAEELNDIRLAKRGK